MVTNMLLEVYNDSFQNMYPGVINSLSFESFIFLEDWDLE